MNIDFCAHSVTRLYKTGNVCSRLVFLLHKMNFKLDVGCGNYMLSGEFNFDLYHFYVRLNSPETGIPYFTRISQVTLYFA